MKFFVILTGCLFFVLVNGGSTEAPEEGLNEAEKLLIEISDKMNHWDKYFTNFNQPPSSVTTDDNDLQESLSENLKESLQICKSNQEQINSILEKLNGGQNFKDSFSNLQQKLDILNSKFEIISKNPERNPAHAASLKNLERKLARLQYSLDRIMLRNSVVPLKSSTDEENSKLGVTQGMEEILAKIGTKVDVLYDKSVAENVFENPKEVRHMGKGCKMLAVPYKKLLTSVDNLQRIVKDLGANDESGPKDNELRNSVVQDIRDSLENILEEIQILRRKNEKNINENERILRRIDKKLDSELEDDDEDDEKLKKSLKKYMIEQRRILEKSLKKMLKDKDNDDDDDDDDDDDSDNKNIRKRKKNKDDTDTDDDDSDDDDKNVRKRKKNKDDTDDDDDDDDEDDDNDDDDDDDDDDIKCDDSDENGSKSCEKEKKKAYSRGKKKPKFDSGSDDDDDDDDDDDADNMPVKGKKKQKKYKVRKDIREIEPLAIHDGNDKLIADEPAQNGNLWSYLAVRPPDVPSKPNKVPDVTP